MKAFVPMTDEQIAREEVIDELARDLEKSQKRVRLTTEELKEIFPEILEIAPKRVKELESVLSELEDNYKKNELIGDSFEVIWEQDRRDEELSKLKKQLMRFRRFLPAEDGVFGFTDAELQDARDFPILDLVDSPRRSGSMYTVFCPMHEERTPSCKIYTRDNSFWCFGCNKGGDTIAFVMARDGVDFVAAVKQLIGGKRESSLSRH